MKMNTECDAIQESENEVAMNWAAIIGKKWNVIQAKYVC